MTTQTALSRNVEPRWAAILALALMLGLIMALPSRYQFAGPWLPLFAGGIGIASMLAVTFAPTVVLWSRVERVVIIGIAAVASILNIVGISRLFGDMLASKHQYGSITLLESAIAIWSMNTLAFALLYWQVDGARAKVRGDDFRFADRDVAESEPAWEPRFVDYLFLAFATSTSFVPPDYSRPSSRRAKLTLMLQASISLATLFLIAARAIASLS